MTALAEQAVTVGQQAVTRQSLASVMGAADDETKRTAFNENFGQSVLASSVALLLIMGVMGLVYFFWSKANMKKKVKYFEHIHTALAAGQRVMFGGGIYGEVKSVNGDVVEVKVRSGATLDVSRYAIQEIVK